MVVHSHNGIVLSLEKGGNSDTDYSMDAPEDITLSEISQPPKDKYYMIHSHRMNHLQAVPREVRFIEAEAGSGRMGSCKQMFCLQNEKRSGD